MNTTPETADRATQQIVTRTARISLEQDGIMRYQLLPCADDTLNDIRVPIRLFSSKTEALDWLRDFLP